jgi:dedicator of cytokinesis protein 1
VEHFTPVRRNKILQKYGDMRKEIAVEVTKMWQSLKMNKIEFIPDLVGPFLDMTLIPEMELRKETLPLFFDMMLTEFRHQSRFSFRQFENELILKLDLMMEGGKGDDLYPDLFRSIITGRLEHHMDMRKVGLNFVESVCQLMQNLLEYRAIMAGDNIELKISSTVNLLNFYESLKRQEVYMRYLHKLWDFHLNAQNFTEAACTLQQYARLLKWSDDEVPLTLQSQQFPDVSTQRELKLKLYLTMIDYFDRGQMWENGIELCKEVAEQYEKQTIDYLALSGILQKQATFFDNIMKQNRGDPGYFRVAYYGLGYPAFMQNKAYVYRGSNWERLSDFTANIQNLYPNAKLLNTLGTPDDTVKFSDRQYLQVNAVTPIMKLPEHLDGRSKPVHEQVLKYYQVNQVQTFMYARRKDESTNDILKLWLEKTYLTISNPLPNILRWYPIVKVESVDVSPIENAIETLEGTNQKLMLLIKEHMKDVNLRVDPLGMVLNGVVDAAVNGGIANYRPFYQAGYVEAHPGDAELVKQLRQMTIRQLVLVQAGLEIHRQRAPDALLPFQARMDQRFNEMKAHMEADYDISLTDDIRTTLSKKIGIPVSMKRSKVGHTPQRYADHDHAASSDKHQARLLNTAHSMVASAIASRSSAASPLSRAATSAAPAHVHSQGEGGRGMKVFHRSHNTSSVASPPAATTSATTITTPPAASTETADTSAKSTPSSSTGASGGMTRSERLIELTQQLTPNRPPRPSSAKVPTSRASLGLLPDLTAGSRDSSPALTPLFADSPAAATSSSSSSKQPGDKPALPRKPRHFLTVQVQPQHLAFLADQ